MQGLPNLLYLSLHLYMIRSYQLKWCFILILILGGGTILMRLRDYIMGHFWAFVNHFFMISFVVFISWVVQVYLRLHEPRLITKRMMPICRISASVIIGVGINWIFSMFMPADLVFPDYVYTNTFADFLRLLIGAFFISMICHIVLSSLAANIMLQKTQLENEHLKQAHLRAQLLSLQQQISPHFLFNSLSTLKNIAHDADTKTFVVQLSHVYRYLLNFNDQQVTRLSEELAFINSYLYILYQRFEGSLKVNINIPEQYHNQLIPPLSIQLLIENAIKHNAFSPEAPLHIDIGFNETGELTVRNDYHPKKFPAESTKLGLQNINERFLLLFNKGIKVSNTSDSFIVNLPVISHESYYH